MRLLVFLAAAIIVFVFLRWIARQPPATRFQFIAVAVGLTHGDEEVEEKKGCMGLLLALALVIGMLAAAILT